MALLRTREIREMTAEEQRSRLKDLRDELMYERGVAAMGGAPPSPGKIRALRRNISRLLTVLTEQEGFKGVRETVTETTEEERA
ncbi:MAG: 50S ribosomal protein L29 [Thermoplasmata archaeon]